MNSNAKMAVAFPPISTVMAKPIARTSQTKVIVTRRCPIAPKENSSVADLWEALADQADDVFLWDTTVMETMIVVVSKNYN